MTQCFSDSNGSGKTDDACANHSDMSWHVLGVRDREYCVFSAFKHAIFEAMVTTAELTLIYGLEAWIGSMSVF